MPGRPGSTPCVTHPDNGNADLIETPSRCGTPTRYRFPHRCLAVTACLVERTVPLSATFEPNERSFQDRHLMFVVSQGLRPGL